MAELAIAEPEHQARQELNLYSDTEYFQALINDISAMAAGDRLAIMTMSFEPSEPLVGNLVKKMSEAAGRGAEVIFGVDAYSFMTDGTKNVGPLWLPLPFGQANYHHRLAVLEELGKKPTATYSIINKPDRLFSRPYAGRSHLKTAVVNNKVYIAGLNLHGSYRADMVVGLENQAIADWLYDISSRIVKTGRTSAVLGIEDQSHQIDDETKILIDAGKPGQSLILDEALRLIAEADESLLISFQYFPTKEIIRQMIAAHDRGVIVKSFHNHPSNYNAVHGIREYLARGMARHSAPKELFGPQLPRDAQFLHSKALATEKAAMVGSHNYVYLGVKFGTPEMALLREDRDFAQQVGRLLIEQTSALSGT